MPRRLVILRHGEATDPSGRGADRDRVLTPRGRDEATRAGRWLAARGLLPDRTLASPAARTRETARLALEAAGADADASDVVDSLYLADVDDLVSVVAALAPVGKTTLLVGHNPGLALLVIGLADDVPSALRHRGLATGALVVVDLPDEGDLVGAGTFVAYETP